MRPRVGFRRFSFLPAARTPCSDANHDSTFGRALFVFGRCLLDTKWKARRIAATTPSPAHRSVLRLDSQRSRERELIHRPNDFIANPNHTDEVTLI